MRLTTFVPSVALLLASAAPSTASADSFRFEIREQMLNKVADEVGSISYSGTHTVRAPDYPCLRCTQTAFGVCIAFEPATCTGPVIMSNNWSATVSNVSFQITSSGITFSASMSSSYGLLNYSAPVSGAVNFDIVSNQIRLRVTTVNVPLIFNIPGIGPITIVTIPVALPYSITLPVHGIGLRTDVEDIQVSAFTKNLVRQYLTDRVRLTGDLSFQ